MAFEQKSTPPWTAVALTTGLKPRRFITISSTKATVGGSPSIKYPTVGGAAYGVLLTGSTGSTKANQAVTVLTWGIARVEAIGSSLHVGHIITCSSVGRAKVSTALTRRLGICVSGSSGTTGRVVSVLLFSPGSTA